MQVGGRHTQPAPWNNAMARLKSIRMLSKWLLTRGQRHATRLLLTWNSKVYTPDSKCNFLDRNTGIAPWCLRFPDTHASRLRYRRRGRTVGLKIYSLVLVAILGARLSVCTRLASVPVHMIDIALFSSLLVTLHRRHGRRTA